MAKAWCMKTSTTVLLMNKSQFQQDFTFFRCLCPNIWQARVGIFRICCWWSDGVWIGPRNLRVIKKYAIKCEQKQCCYRSSILALVYPWPPHSPWPRYFKLTGRWYIPVYRSSSLRTQSISAGYHHLWYTTDTVKSAYLTFGIYGMESICCQWTHIMTAVDNILVFSEKHNIELNCLFHYHCIVWWVML